MLKTSYRNQKNIAMMEKLKAYLTNAISRKESFLTGAVECFREQNVV